MVSKNYLGQGIGYPLTITQFGRPALVARDALVKQSIYYILSTPKGQAFFNPEFGSTLSTLYFEQADEVLYAQIDYAISDALGKWEKRIKVNDITCTIGNDDSVIYCEINYTILASNEVGSIVYPYYKN